MSHISNILEEKDNFFFPLFCLLLLKLHLLCRLEHRLLLNLQGLHPLAHIQQPDQQGGHHGVLHAGVSLQHTIQVLEVLGQQLALGLDLLFRGLDVLEQVQNLVSAFKWKRLAEALGGVSGDEYGVLFRNVTRCDDLIEQHVRELARRRSWKKALDRIDPKTLSQMQRYALESRKYGAGTGITAARRMKEIRKLLNDCWPAIPAWIMPIDQVAQRFTAELEMFDVIIVDEASQARLDSIFLLALSKRVIIVGDHKQVSPDGGMLPDAEVQSIVNRHLADDSRKANWGNTDLSLFDECKAAFGNMVTLTEHRRCVPEIIGFSNQIAYIPENIRLIPVRQTGSEALPPIKTIFVPNGYVRKTSGQPENPPEADAIANEVDRKSVV
jgi:hypothetical protein